MPVITIPHARAVWVNGRRNILPEDANAKRQEKARARSRAVQIEPRLDLVTPGSPLALDCEGVLLPQETSWRKHGVGRVSITNTNGQVIYGVFTHYPRGVEHRPSPQRLKLGVTYKDIRPENGAQPHAEVLATVKKIFDKSGIVVAFAAINDIRMLHGIDFSPYVVRDVQGFHEYRQYALGQDGIPSLRILASEVLERPIQQEEHSSVEDAQATMDLFLLHHDTYEFGCDYTGRSLSPSSESTCSGHSKTTSHTTTTSLTTTTAISTDNDTSAASPISTNTAPLDSSGRKFAPGSLVALPEIKAFARGRVFDCKTSTFM